MRAPAPRAGQFPAACRHRRLPPPLTLPPLPPDQHRRCSSMRQLKHHEHKLLKKVDFLQWKNEHNLREVQVR